MTTDMHLIERAYELGRAAERQKMADLASITSNQKLADLANTVSTVYDTTHKAATKAAAAPRAPKATIVARGVKAAPKSRTKGVKSAIVNLIASGPTTVEKIIDHTGFKKNSVVSTLMDLKKKGIAMQDGKAWISMGGDSSGGNSETGAYTGS